MPFTPTGLPQEFSTGASWVYLGLGSGNAPLYFGTCEGYPRDERKPEYEMLMNDLSGRKVPLDFCWQGETATISLVMTRWDEGMIRMLEAKPNPMGSALSGLGASNPGTWNFTDVGALAMLEGLGVPLWIRYPFAPVTVGGGGGGRPAMGLLTPGYHYIQSIVWAPETAEVGAAPMKRHIQFFAWPYANYVAKTFTLYDYNMSNLPSPN